MAPVIRDMVRPGKDGVDTLPVRRALTPAPTILAISGLDSREVLTWVRKTIGCAQSTPIHDHVMGWFVNRSASERVVYTWLSPL